MPKINQDIIFWIGLIILGVFTGTTLMFRDVHQGFGTVTFGAVPEFEFEDQLGNSVSQNDFSNQVWVGSYISPNCENNKSCQDLIQMAASIHQQIKDDPKISMVSLLSHSETAEFKSLIQKLQIENKRWKFLNGEAKTINLIAASCLQKKLPDSGYDNRFFLVDQNGIIRGYYQADKLDEVKQLIRDIKKLV